MCVDDPVVMNKCGRLCHHEAVIRSELRDEGLYVARAREYQGYNPADMLSSGAWIWNVADILIMDNGSEISSLKPGVQSTYIHVTM